MTAEQPSAEWQAAVDAQPYRIACYVIGTRRALYLRAPWHVVDIRPEDEPTVAGPFRTRAEALAAAAELNAGTRTT